MKDAFCCLAEHVQPCNVCRKKIRTDGGNELECKPVQRSDPVNMKNYTSFHARRKFLQMPIAALSIETNKNQLVIFLVAKGSNYKMFASVLRQILVSKLQRNNSLLTRNNFNTLLHLCQSDTERERIRYVVGETSGLSQQKLSQQL